MSSSPLFDSDSSTISLHPGSGLRGHTTSSSSEGDGGLDAGDSHNGGGLDAGGSHNGGGLEVRDEFGDSSSIGGLEVGDSTELEDRDQLFGRPFIVTT